MTEPDTLAGILNEALQRAEAGKLPPKRKKPNLLAAYRHRNKVRFYLDSMLRTYGNSPSKVFLRGAFGSTWRKVLNFTYGDEPRAVAVSVMADLIGSALERSLTDDQRKLALYALQEGVGTEPVAIHLRNVFSDLGGYVEHRVELLNVYYHAIAALEGFRGADRMERVRRRFIEHLADSEAHS